MSELIRLTMQWHCRDRSFRNPPRSPPKTQGKRNIQAFQVAIQWLSQVLAYLMKRLFMRFCRTAKSHSL